MPSLNSQSRLGSRAMGKIRYARRQASRRILDRESVVGRAANTLLGGGYFIALDYPPSAHNEPRYGYGRPSHQRLARLIGEHDGEYRSVLRELMAYKADLLAIPLDQVDAGEPHWRNGMLFGIDGVTLYGFTRKRSPRRYIEIGSGNSTLFVDRARRDGKIDMEIVSIDPFPRREIDAICDNVIRQPLETTDLGIFDDLHPGDIVFFDGSHRVFMNSDAVVFFLDVLPELPPGVLVGIHDIQLPDDYRPEHASRYYSEQYLLASYLLGESRWIRPLLPCWYVSHHPQLGDLARSLIPPAFLQAPTRPPYSPPQTGSHGVIGWLSVEPR
jgi:hypothetical protein